jgi:integrase
MAGKRANGEGSIFPYRNSYAAYVWVEKPDGRRIRKYVYGKDRDEVHDKWIALHQKAKDGPVATSSDSLSAYLTYWLDELVEPNLAPATHENYERFTRLYIRPGLGKQKVHRLQQRDVQTWINKVARTCQCCAQGKDSARPEPKRRCCGRVPAKCCKDTLSARSLSDIRNTLRAALASAVQEGLLSKNVASETKLPAIRKTKRRSWDSDQARTFLESARSDGDPFYAAYALVLVLGLRRGEVLGLTWENIDLDNAELSVGLQLQRVRGQLHHRVTKTEGSDATLPLPPMCVAALRLRYAQQKADREKAGDAWHNSGLVFTTRLGGPIEPRNFFRSFIARIPKAGTPRISVHDARRTCGSLLADLDVHPRVAMQILRHADFKVTMEVYTQVSSKQTRDALRRLSDSLEAEAGTRATTEETAGSDGADAGSQVG